MNSWENFESFCRVH